MFGFLVEPSIQDGGEKAPARPSGYDQLGLILGLDFGDSVNCSRSGREMGHVDFAVFVFTESRDGEVGVEQFRGRPGLPDPFGCPPDPPGAEVGVKIHARHAGIHDAPVPISPVTEQPSE